MRNLLLLFISIFTFFTPGKPVLNARVFLESNRSNQLIAFQQTGETGKASFKFLDAGNYQLLLQFPQQGGKWIKEKRRHQTLTKATFNENNRTYYYQGEEGFFSVKISGTKKINKENFRAVFHENEVEDGVKIAIAQFRADKQGAQITVFVKAITAAQFKRFTEKLESDISTISILGTK